MNINPETGLPVLPEGLEWYIEPPTRFGLESHTNIHIARMEEEFVPGRKIIPGSEFLTFESTPRYAVERGRFGSEKRVFAGVDYRGLRSVCKHYIFMDSGRTVEREIAHAARMLLAGYKRHLAGQAEADALNASLQKFSGSYPPNSIAK